MEHTNEQTAAQKPDKKVTIIVNGREHSIEEKTISFEEVIVLAFGAFDPNPDIAYTVSFSNGHSGKEKGVLTPGMKVKVKKGMVFNATRTNRS